MKKLYKILFIGLVIIFQSLLKADIRVSENPTINTPDSIYYHVNQILELNQRNHSEALSTIFGIYAEIDQEVLNSMMENEFSRINDAVNNATTEFVNQENLQTLNDNNPNLVELKNILQRIQALEEFNVLLVEVGAVSDGLKHLEKIYQKHIEILQSLNNNTTVEEQNSLQYVSQGARLISEQVREIIIPQRRQILNYLDNNTDDPDITTFINDKNNKLEANIIGE